MEFAFFVNKFFVFKSKNKHLLHILKEHFLFLGTRIISGLIEIFGLPLLVYIGMDQRIFDIEGAVAKAVIAVVVIITNYLFGKYLAFRKSKHTVSLPKQNDN